jgi:hypothetical protein
MYTFMLVRHLEVSTPLAPASTVTRDVETRKVVIFGILLNMPKYMSEKR